MFTLNKPKIPCTNVHKCSAMVDEFYSQIYPEFLTGGSIYFFQITIQIQPSEYERKDSDAWPTIPDFMQVSAGCGAFFNYRIFGNSGTCATIFSTTPDGYFFNYPL